MIKKSFIAAIAILMLVTSGVAQKSAINRARSSMDAQQFSDAKEAIDEATKHEDTKNMAITWFVRGQVYQYINRDLLGKQHLDLDSNALTKSYKAYIKAIELGEKEMAEKAAKKKRNKEPKPYRDKETIIDNLSDFVSPEFKRAGVDYYQKGNYKKALEMIEKGIEIDAMPEINKTDTTFIYYSAILANELEQYDKALKYFKKAQQLGYGIDMPELDENGEPKLDEKGNPITSSKTATDIILSIGNIHMTKGDTLKAIKTYEDGLKDFGENIQLLSQVINYYLSVNNVDIANKYLDEALAKEPDNKTYNFAKGTLHDQLGQDTTLTAKKREKHLQTAIEFYEKALESDETYINPLYNLGVIYYNKAAAVVEEAREIPLSKEKEYNAKIKEANEKFKVALPYFEKVLEIKPEESGAITSLMVIYQQLGMEDKAKEMEEKLK